MNHEPSDTQLQRCLLMGWTHIGDGFFAKDDYIGWFEQRNFRKVYAPGKQQTLLPANSASHQARLNDPGSGSTFVPSDHGAP